MASRGLPLSMSVDITGFFPRIPPRQLQGHICCCQALRGTWASQGTQHTQKITAQPPLCLSLWLRAVNVAFFKAFHWVCLLISPDFFQGYLQGNCMSPQLPSKCHMHNCTTGAIFKISQLTPKKLALTFEWIIGKLVSPSITLSLAIKFPDTRMAPPNHISLVPHALPCALCRMHAWWSLVIFLCLNLTTQACHSDMPKTQHPTKQFTRWCDDTYGPSLSEHNLTSNLGFSNNQPIALQLGWKEFRV